MSRDTFRDRAALAALPHVLQAQVQTIMLGGVFSAERAAADAAEAAWEIADALDAERRKRDPHPTSPHAGNSDLDLGDDDDDDAAEGDLFGDDDDGNDGPIVEIEVDALRGRGDTE